MNYHLDMSRPPASLRALAVARGDEPADLLITGGRVLSPITREWIATDLAIADGVQTTLFETTNSSDYLGGS